MPKIQHQITTPGQAIGINRKELAHSSEADEKIQKDKEV